MQIMGRISFPVAQLSYHDHYFVKINEAQLKKMAHSSFTTHCNSTAEKIHQASQCLLLPWRKSLQMLGKALQPAPGANKDQRSIGFSRPICILRGMGGVFGLLTSIAVMILTSPVHFAAAIAYRSRPVMGYIDNFVKMTNHDVKLSSSENDAAHHVRVRTHNLGFILETLSTTGDLRPVCERAKGVVESIRKDLYQPDLIMFQEAFHEDGVRLLCEGLKNTYPYMLTNVLPTASGFNSGTLVMSKYPIMDAQFHCLKHNLGLERLSPKGMMRVKIQTAQGQMSVYGAHTQAILGKDRSEARAKQLDQIHTIMKADYENDQIPQLLVGDLNTSVVTAWGENNIADENNPEKKVQDKLKSLFSDLFLKDHDATTGERSFGGAKYLKSDNARMGVELPEPSGSWYVGPFATANSFLAASVIEMGKRDRIKYNYSAPVIKSKDVSIKAPAWGTKDWKNEQLANTARFDYTLVPKYCQNRIDGRAEIRRGVVASSVQSADTDHLPVDVEIVLKNVRDSFNARKSTLFS